MEPDAFGRRYLTAVAVLLGCSGGLFTLPDKRRRGKWPNRKAR
jgi:hypothetical protein